MSEIREKKLLAAYKWFNSEEGMLVLADLDLRFGYNEPDFEDHNTVLDIKPHERRGQKMPLKHIRFMMTARLTKPTHDPQTHEVTTKIKEKSLHAPEESGQEGS